MRIVLCFEPGLERKGKLVDAKIQTERITRNSERDRLPFPPEMFNIASTVGRKNLQNEAPFQRYLKSSAIALGNSILFSVSGVPVVLSVH